ETFSLSRSAPSRRRSRLGFFRSGANTSFQTCAQWKWKAGFTACHLRTRLRFKIRNTMHVSRTFATLLKGSGEDVKTVQELMRHASSRLTLDVYAQALTPTKRAAHLKLVGLIQPAAETAIGPLWSNAE